MRREFLYLVAVMDWFTRKFLAWGIYYMLEADVCVEALNAAIHRFGPPEIMNMEHGRATGSSGHATSGQPVHLLRLSRLAEPGGHQDLAGRQGPLPRQHFVKRLWRSLKYECVDLHAWNPGSQAKTGNSRWITFDNHHRPLTALGGQPPAVVSINHIETDQQVQATA